MKAALVFCAILLLASVSITAVQSLRCSFADDQTEIFNAMTEKATKAAPAEAIACLEYVLDYYPSGTKQAKGSKLDRVVERARQSAVREIIAHLRAKTGEDLGDDPS